MRTISDFEYEKKRNELIPHAEAEANRICGKTAKEFDGDVTIWGLFWNRTYIGTMDRMAKETGLIK